MRPISPSEIMPICLANGDQTVMEQAVFGFFILLFLIAATLNFTSARTRRAPANAQSSRFKLEQPLPRGRRSLKTFWARCRWEMDVLKTYLEETINRYLATQPESNTAQLSQSVEPHPPADRRRWTRHPSNLRAVCWLNGGVAQDTWLASVRDISGGGIGLIAPYRPALGAVLNLQLVSANFVEQQPLRAEVMFVTQQSTSRWVLGCEFLSSLTPEQQELYL